MTPEIALLIKHFEGEKWDHKTQSAFMGVLREENFFNGKGEKDPAFSARDRINRAPKSLGFIVLSPKIELTPAGRELIGAKRTDEIFLRQMLKFQLPSPYHKPSDRATCFCIKPYLELLRLVRIMGTLRFDELQIFGMQLTDWHKFDDIVEKIKLFRRKKAKNKGSYRVFKRHYLSNELKEIYSDRIRQGNTKTRESADASLEKFLRTQASNMRDYADACFRYLRATGLVEVSQMGKSLSIVPDRITDVDYLLKEIDRNPIQFDSEIEYCNYLGDAYTPKLFTDNRSKLLKKLSEQFPEVTIPPTSSVKDLKIILGDLQDTRKKAYIENAIKDIKEYRLYDHIQNVFDGILTKEFYDNPTMLEWNTWRAMTMLDGGNINANLNFDDFGNPLSTAAGNMPDIVCDYEDFLVAVEVTMTSGQKQFETEGESVTRHLGKLKVSSGKPCYGLFIAPTINEATISFFYTLHRTRLAIYGGTSVIVPLPLKVFQKMVQDSRQASYTPDPKHVQRFFETSKSLALCAEDEQAWYQDVLANAMSWLE